MSTFGSNHQNRGKMSMKPTKSVSAYVFVIKNCSVRRTIMLLHLARAYEPKVSVNLFENCKVRRKFFQHLEDPTTTH